MDRYAFKESIVSSNSNVIDEEKDANWEEMDCEFRMELHVETKSKCELTQYLNEPCENVGNLDILQWWKLNSIRYPILSKVARDVLAILVSTVASEQAFST
ncbi:hypothetical protein LIER_39924 [Lithospermum erythrorhizon]|uniref:HAT C-terminal dimerisation domain-containing protein n=1 Tax=Lithospermum erythrorhizon TaxID=34254 RepID=A0AAV3QR98_LITER